MKKIIDNAKLCLSYIQDLNITRCNLNPHVIRNDSLCHDFHSKLKNLRKTVIELALKYRDTDNFLNIKKYILIEQMLGQKIGNCEELALLTLALLYKINEECRLNYKVAYCSGIGYFDHAFLILNAEIHNYSNKHSYTYLDIPESALILDPWIGCCFSPSKAQDFLIEVAKMYRWNFLSPSNINSLRFIFRENNLIENATQSYGFCSLLSQNSSVFNEVFARLKLGTYREYSLKEERLTSEIKIQAQKVKPLPLYDFIIPH